MISPAPHGDRLAKINTNRQPKSRQAGRGEPEVASRTWRAGPRQGSEDPLLNMISPAPYGDRLAKINTNRQPKSRQAGRGEPDTASRTRRAGPR